MLTIVLAEAELELVPRKIVGHKQVMAAARSVGREPDRMLLDASSHHAAMRALPEGGRRGRPDIVHVSLLTALESRANKNGHMRLAVHTRNDDWIDVGPETRLIRNYPRFVGLIEKLFETGAVPADPVLLRLRKDVALDRGLEALAPDRLLWCDEAAPVRDPASLFGSADGGRNVVAVIGAFPSGTFHTTPPPEADAVSFGPEPLAAWTVAAELTVRYEDHAQSE